MRKWRRIDAFRVLVNGKNHIMYACNFTDMFPDPDTDSHVYVDGQKTSITTGYWPLTAARKIYGNDAVEDMEKIPFFGYEK